MLTLFPPLKLATQATTTAADVSTTNRATVVDATALNLPRVPALPVEVRPMVAGLRNAFSSGDAWRISDRSDRPCRTPRNDRIGVAQLRGPVRGADTRPRCCEPAGAVRVPALVQTKTEHDGARHYVERMKRPDRGQVPWSGVTVS